METAHAVVGQIIIETDDIFDLSIPEENRKLYRAANRLHIATRPKIIERQLLFKTGEPFDHRLLEESERILRANKYLRDATVVPFAFHDGVVDVLVHTDDVWTLDPRFSFGRSGGENSATLGIRDSNLAGLGIYLGLFARTNVDRDSTELTIADQQLGSTWYAASMSYADNSDGQKLQASFGRPFYALDSPRSLGIGLLDEDRTDSLYDRGDIQAKFGHELSRLDLFAGVSAGLINDRVNRYSVGVAYEDDSFYEVPENPDPSLVLPNDRRYIYPYFQWEMLEDKYEESENHDQIGRVEDRYLGTRIVARAGYASQSMGSSDDALMLEGSFSTGFGRSDSDSLLTALNVHGRYESGEFRDLLLNYDATYHHRHHYGGLLHVELSGSLGLNPDLDHQLLLGGDSGLRGYPLRYQGGDSSALFTVEERLFTDWYPFHLVRIGGAVFFDAGRTWGENPVGDENLGWLKDVGFGFRFGNDRSGIGRVVHLDFAFPLDGEDDIDNFQILVAGKTSF